MGHVSATKSYLAGLDRSLSGPPSVRRGLLREVGDHLEDATDAYRRAGHGQAEAEERAVADFGTLDEVVPGFRTTLAVASARRTALILLAALGIQPFLWDSGLRLGDRVDGDAPDSVAFHLLDVLVEVGGFLGLLGAVITLGLTAVGQRWLRDVRLVARIAAWYALGVAVTVPVLGLSMMLLTRHATVLLVALAGVLIVAPLAAAGAAARRTLAAC